MTEPRSYKRKPMAVAVCRPCVRFYKMGARGRCGRCERPLRATVIFNGKQMVEDA